MWARSKTRLSPQQVTLYALTVALLVTELFEVDALLDAAHLGDPGHAASAAAAVRAAAEATL